MKFKKGQSGNPAGKAPGTLNRKTRVAQALDDSAEDVTKAVIDAAKGGDMQAARLVLERVKPPLRARAELSPFPLDATAPLTAQGQQILSACAAGTLDVDTAKVLIDCLSSFAGLRQTDELATRLAALEEAVRDNPQGDARGGVVHEGDPV